MHSNKRCQPIKSSLSDPGSRNKHDNTTCRGFGGEFGNKQVEQRLGRGGKGEIERGREVGWEGERYGAYHSARGESQFIRLIVIRALRLRIFST